MVTLLSKDTVNKVVKVIKETIASEVREAKRFSDQTDTTQDIASKEQCSVILRYVTDIVHEKLVALVDCEEASSWEYLLKLLKDTITSLNLD